MFKLINESKKLFNISKFSTLNKPWAQPMSAFDFDFMRQILAAPRYILHFFQ